MSNDITIDEFERLPLRYAYQFLSEKGVHDKAEEIKNARDSYKSYTSTLRRAKIINLMEEHNWLDEFIERYWPAGKTSKGQNQIKGLRRLYDNYSNRGDVEEFEVEEDIDGTSFAYEEDLKNYLASNLAVIESGLKLYYDADGQEGIEYPIDSNGKRIDILAIDNSCRG